VAANLLMALCLVGGFLALRSIKQEVFPDFTVDAVNVSVEYPGASPEEVEEGIILPVEEAVQGVDGVDEVTSTAGENFGRVTVEAVSGTDLQKLTSDIQSEIDHITTFPDETEEPEVEAISHRRGVLNLILYGNVDRKTLHALADNTRDRLLQNEDITQIDISGLPELEISIEVPQQTLRRYGLTLDEIANRIRARALDLPGGDIDTESGEVLLRMKERRDYGEEFARLPLINAAGGSQVTVGDIARVHDGFEETDRFMTFDGHPAVTLEVYRIGDQTPIQVCEAISSELESLQSELPAGIQTHLYRNRADHYRQRANLMLKNGAMGLVLVMVLLGIFLEARLAFWVMMGIPISFLGSFFLLPLMGISLNMLSMFAFIIALGIVVDDAIVVGENVYSYHQQGVPFLEAAIKGAREVAMPVTFSILTNIAAFLPIYFIPGVTGKIFGVIPVVVICAFLISLGECLFILPAHLGHHRERAQNPIAAWFHRQQQRFSRAFTRWVRNRYGPFLNAVLRHRYLAFVSAFCLLVLVLAYAGSGRMGMGLFPQTESDHADAEVVFPYGTPSEKTDSAARRLVEAARKVIADSGHEELLEGILVDIGRGGSHSGRVRVLLAEPEVRERTLSTAEFARRWRQNTGEIVGTEYVKFESAGGGPGHRDPINVELRHRDIDVLRRASAELAAELRDYPIVSQVNDGFQPGKPQFDLKMKPEGKALGLTAMEVGRQVRDAFYGARAIRQLRGRNEVDVRVKLPQSQRNSEYYLEEFMVRTPAGTFVPLRNVVRADRGRAYVTIDRRNGRRVVQVTADATPRSRAGEVLGDLKIGALPALVEKYPELDYGFEGIRADISESMGSLRISFIMAMLAIYAMLAIPFRSYVQPLIVMLSIPFGIVGAVVGHLVMGYSMSVISLFGVVALAGVVVNDSLILVTFANRARESEGLSARDAIHEAAIQRFRPVVLTSLTTFGGLAPLIFETSRQARMMIPMAISLGFGILFALFITLAIVPTLYMTVADAKRLLAGTETGPENPEVAPATD
jgi:multidrug efflux pump subunit AcrB